MKKKWMLLFLLVSYLLCSCTEVGNNSTQGEDSVISALKTGSSEHTYTIADEMEVSVSFSEALAISDSIVVGEFLSQTRKNDNVEYTFQTKEILRGTAEDTIHVFKADGSSYGMGTSYTYEPGKEYLLVMSRENSLFNDYPHYVSIASIYLSIDAIEKGSMYGEGLSKFTEMKEVEEIKSYIAAQLEEYVEKEKNYITSNDLETVVRESDFILNIKVKELMTEGILHNGNTYYCEVQDVLKGEGLVMQGNNEIMIVMMKGSVKEGEGYIVLVNQTGENSYLYTQSSLQSIMGVDKQGVIEGILKTR